MDYRKLYQSFQDRYFNRLEIGYRLSGEVSLEETWKAILAERQGRAEILPLTDEHGKGFWFVNTKPLQAKLHHIDGRGKDSLSSQVRREIEDELVLDSIIDEAWASTIIEGAFTTHKRAQELVRRNLAPKNKNELMMKNNHLAMIHIMEHRDADFSIDFILELHRIITQNTLDDPEYAGKFRNDDVYILDKAGNVIFKPMPAQFIRAHMDSIVKWVKADSEEEFIHPILKASIIHFYLAYIHPFFDANGRTSRALFYFYLLKHRYEFFKYFSISAIIAKQREKYYKAIKDVGDYDNDLTYFLIFSSDVVLKSIEEITNKILKKYQSKIISKELDKKGIFLNKRQNKFVKLSIEQEMKIITTRKYQKIFKVAYGTARSDLNGLVEHGIFKKRAFGKGFVYDIDVKAFLT